MKIKEDHIILTHDKLSTVGSSVIQLTLKWTTIFEKLQQVLFPLNSDAP